MATVIEHTLIVKVTALVKDTGKAVNLIEEETITAIEEVIKSSLPDSIPAIVEIEQVPE